MSAQLTLMVKKLKKLQMIFWKKTRYLKAKEEMHVYSTNQYYSGTKDVWKKSWQVPLLQMIFFLLIAVILFQMRSPLFFIAPIGVSNRYLSFSENYWCDQTFGVVTGKKPIKFS